MSLQHRVGAFSLTFLGLAALTACGGGGGAAEASLPSAQQAAAQPKRLRCDQLPGTTIPAEAIGLPTSGARINSALVVPATGSGASLVPEHCLVNASIAPVDPAAPNINFRVALPTQWNAKAVMFGGGGFNGSIPNVTGNVSNGPVDMPRPIGRGYATFASDSGHQANALGSQDGSWGLNDEAVRNFGGDALKKTRDASMAVIKLHYGRGVARAYFAGGSTGGREALASIQRWPEDWDGAIAWYPAWNDAAALLAGHKMSRTLAQPGAYPSSGKRLAVFRSAMQACDALDGASDGLISDQRRCNAVFDPATATLDGAPLRCPGGIDTGDSCLSDVQIAALKSIDAPATFNFPLASGETGYPGYNVWGSDLGIHTIVSPVQTTHVFLNFGWIQPTHPMPPLTPYISLLTDQWFKYSVTRDASFNSLTLDPENPGPWAARISELSRQLDTSTDISRFVHKGGKLLLAHGLSDVLVSSRATEDYYKRLLAQFGQNRVDRFARYYEVPGLGHAVSSQFNATWDSLTALERWVEDDVAPAGQVTTDTVGVPGRTRPMCDFPKWPRYDGSGDVNLAGSFTCVQ